MEQEKLIWLICRHDGWWISSMFPSRTNHDQSTRWALNFSYVTPKPQHIYITIMWGTIPSARIHIIRSFSPSSPLLSSPSAQEKKKTINSVQRRRFSREEREVYSTESRSWRNTTSLIRWGSSPNKNKK